MGDLYTDTDVLSTHCFMDKAAKTGSPDLRTRLEQIRVLYRLAGRAQLLHMLRVYGVWTVILEGNESESWQRGCSMCFIWPWPASKTVSVSTVGPRGAYLK